MLKPASRRYNPLYYLSNLGTHGHGLYLPWYRLITTLNKVVLNTIDDILIIAFMTITRILNTTHITNKVYNICSIQHLDLLHFCKSGIFEALVII